MITTREKPSGTIIITAAPWPLRSRTFTLTPRMMVLNTPQRNDFLPALTRKLVGVACLAIGSIAPEDVYGPLRHPALMWARSAVAWTLRQLEPMPSLYSLCTLLDRTDHGSALNWLRNAEKLRKSNPQFEALTNHLKTLLPV